MKRIGQHQLSFLNGLLAVFALGMAAAEAFPAAFASVRMELAGFGCMMLALTVWAARGERAWTWASCALFFFALGAARMSAALPLPADDIARHTGEAVRVVGVLRETPRVRPSADGEGVRVRYVVDAVRAGTETASGGLYVSAGARSADAVTARAGDTIAAEGRLAPLHGYQNPGMIDTARLARARGVTARLSAGKEGAVVLAAADGGVRRRIEDVRAHYLARMREAMPEADAAALFAMLFGGYDGLREELTEAFTATGLVHILSVSGSHITLLLGLIARLSRAARLPRFAAAALALAAAAGYAALAGFVAPAVRAALMGALAFAAFASDRVYDARRALALTALFLLGVSPLLFFDVSFQLSFASTAGLLYVAPPMRGWRLFERLPRAARDAIALTAGAQLASFPICAWYFHVLPLPAFLANLIVAPILELMIALGLAAGLLALALPFAARVLFAADSLLLGLSYELTRALAALPMSRVYLPPMGAGASALYYGALMLALQGAADGPSPGARLWRACPRPWIALALCALGLVCAAAPLWRLHRPAEMAVHFIDVGQGDAALVVTPHGRAFMIDTGGARDAAFDLGGRVDVPYLLQYGVTSLDAVFLTHAHADHAAGLAGVLRRVPVARVVTAGEGRAAYRAVLGVSEAALDGVSFSTAREGMRATLDGVTVDVLAAPDAPKGAASGNETCGVYRVSYGRASFLFTGDMMKAQEAALLAAQGADALRSAVLKVAHHGARTSSSAPFLTAAAPRWAVVSVGAANTFGHPSEETLAALSAVGAEIYRTDRDGAIVFRTDGASMRVETYVKRE